MDESPALIQAADRLQKVASVGSPHSARSGAESRYGQAYQAQVRDGKKPQIRAKYRVPAAGKKMPGGGNTSGHSNGKHTPHPDVPGFRKKGYRSEAKWNKKEKD